MNMVIYGEGTAADPWVLKTPPGSSEFHAWIDGEVLQVAVGKTKLGYQRRGIEDCLAMLKERGDWVELGNADEGKPVKEGSVEAWARDESNPVGGYYGVRKGYRGRFANYVTPVMELMGLVELEHKARGNRVRAV
ncbi:MAG: DUF6855 family protein [Pseudomonadota bacterium]